MLSECGSLVTVEEHARRLLAAGVRLQRHRRRVMERSGDFGGLLRLVRLLQARRPRNGQEQPLEKRVYHRINSLLEKGLFVSESQIIACLRRTSEKSSSPRPVSAIGLLSGKLTRSPSRLNGASNEAARIIVCGDCDDRAENQGLPAKGMVWRVSAAARDRLICFLTSSGVEESIARFAVEGLNGFPNTGATFNMLMLLTPGERVLSIDDNICPDPLLRTGECAEGLVVHSSSDPRRVRFDVPAGGIRAARSLQQAVSVMLGATVGELAEKTGEFRIDPDLSARALDAIIRHGGTLRIATVLPGMLEKTSSDWRTWLSLVANLSSTDLAAADRPDNEMLAGGCCARSVDRLVVSLGDFFDGRCFGFDNDGPVVPFSPNFAGCDHLFGIMLRLSMPDAGIGYIPEMVSWDSRESASLLDSSVQTTMPALPQSLSPGMCRLLAGLVRTLQPEWPTNDPESWCSYTSAGLEAISATSASTFSEFVYECAHSEWTRAHRQVEDLLDRQWFVSKASRLDFVRLRRRLEETLGNPSNALPYDILTPGNTGDGINMVQSYIRDFARLLTAWPRMWHACAGLSVAERHTLLFGSNPASHGKDVALAALEGEQDG